MRFDLFYELSVPAYSGRTERQVFHETLGEIELADQLGFDTVWLVEHHLMPGYSHASAPELFLAAAAQRTRRIRLGHGVIPLPYHHPVHVAERLATLDVLSEGRVEFGYGRGFSPDEYRCFGLEMNESRSRTAESLEIILRGLAGDRLDYQGEHYRLSDIRILPSPVQTPHPPVWSAAVSPESFELAARNGVGALAGPFKPWFMVREDIKHYRAVQAERDAGGDRPPGRNDRLGMTVGVYCDTDGRRARSTAKPAFEWFYRHLLEQTRPVLEELHEGYEYYRKWGRFRGLIGQGVTLRLLEMLGMVVVGTPAECIARLRELEAAGVDHVLCAPGAGALATDQHRRTLNLLAEEVMPALARADS